MTDAILDGIPDPSRKKAKIAESPTWLLIVGCYAGFATLTYHWNLVPAWIAISATAYLICLDMHLMHEVLHGHPTRNDLINRLAILPNLGIYMPYEIYKAAHIRHHEVEHLTNPENDPESFYVSQERWDALPVWARWVLTANNSMLGRILIGPALAVGKFWISEIKRFARSDTAFAGAWAFLLLNNALLAYWLFWVCEIPVWQFGLGLYFGLSLVLVRSYTEHRPSDDQQSRCIIVEGGMLTQLLFLNNCFHLVHHDRPCLPWYEIPKVYRADRDAWRARTGGHWFSSYWDVFRRYALTPKDSPRHPVF